MKYLVLVVVLAALLVPATLGATCTNDDILGQILITERTLEQAKDAVSCGTVCWWASLPAPTGCNARTTDPWSSADVWYAWRSKPGGAAPTGGECRDFVQAVDPCDPGQAGCPDASVSQDNDYGFTGSGFATEQADHPEECRAWVVRRSGNDPWDSALLFLTRGERNVQHAGTVPKGMTFDEIKAALERGETVGGHAHGRKTFDEEMLGVTFSSPLWLADEPKAIEERAHFLQGLEKDGLCVNRRGANLQRPYWDVEIRNFRILTLCESEAATSTDLYIGTGSSDVSGALEELVLPKLRQAVERRSLTLQCIGPNAAEERRARRAADR